MLNGSLDEDHGAGDDRLLPPTCSKHCFPADDDVHFVLGVGLLLVCLPNLEAIEAHAKGRHSQELPPALVALLAFPRQIVQVKGLHRPSTSVAYAGAPCSGVVGVQANL